MSLSVSTSRASMPLRWPKALLVLMALVIGLQLIAVTRHDHGFVKHAPDCASCMVAGHFGGGLPIPPVPVLASVALLMGLLLVRASGLPASASFYFLPPSRAPPVR